MPFELPLAAQDVLEQPFAAAARLVVRAVIRSHNDFHASLFDTCLKGGQIRFPKILFTHNRIETVSLVLRTGMHSKVLCAGSDLHIRIVVPLHSLNKSDTQSRSQVRILSKCFMSPAPSRIAENIYIGRPERKSFVNVIIAVLLLHIKLRASFVGNRLRNLLHKILIKRSGQTDRLREHGRRTRSRYAVKRFVPVIIGLHTQSVYRWRPVKCLVHFLFQCHIGDKGLRSLFKRLHSVLRSCAYIRTSLSVSLKTGLNKTNVSFILNSPMSHYSIIH